MEEEYWEGPDFVPSCLSFKNSIPVSGTEVTTVLVSGASIASYGCGHFPSPLFLFTFPLYLLFHLP